MYITEFIRKFSLFQSTNLKTDDSNNTMKDNRFCVSEIMSKADLDETLYKIGINQVSLKYSYCLKILRLCQTKVPFIYQFIERILDDL